MATVIDDRTEFLQRRRAGVGGSDVAALFGLHPFKTALDVWRDKVEDVQESEPSPAMLRGIYLEDVAVQLYAERTGRKVRRHGQRQHAEHPHLIANVDRQVLAGEGRGTGALEVKCPGLQVFWRVKRAGLLDYMILQAQHEALVCGYDYTSFALFNAERFELIHFDIEADPGVHARIVEVAGEFWTKHVLAGIPPQNGELPGIELPAIGDGSLVVRADPEWEKAASDLASAREIKAEAEALYEAAKVRLIELAGGYGVFEGGGVRVYYRQMPGRKSFKKDLLKKDHPEIDLSTYEVQGTPFDEFRPYVLRSGDE
jgi:putative phage-type endonuclease